MNKQFKELISDGIVLLSASVVLALCTHFIIHALKDESYDGNPLTSDVRNMADKDRVYVQKQATSQIEKQQETQAIAKLSSKELKKLILNRGTQMMMENRAQFDSIAREKLAKYFDASNNNEAQYKAKLESLTSRDNHGCTALMMICYSSYDDAASMLETDVNRLSYISPLIEKGAGLDAKDNDGWSALSWASWSGLHQITDKLIQLGALADQFDHRGNTPLMIAAIKGNTEVIQVLLNKGATITVTNQEGKTALALAQQELAKISRSGALDLVSSNRENNTERYKIAVQLLSQQTNSNKLPIDASK